MSNATNDYFADRGFTGDPMFHTEMDRAQPAEAISVDAKPHHWRAMQYEAGDVSGTMLLAGPNTAAPDVHYPLNAVGWHAISVGIMPARGRLWHASLRVRLTDDAAESMLVGTDEAPSVIEDKSIVELFWKTADLTGQDLHIGQATWREAPGSGIGTLRGTHARVAYVKLIPLSDAEVDAVEKDRSTAEHRTLFAHQDAHGPHWLWRLTTADQIRREIEPYRDTDFSRMYWECGIGDLMFHFTKVGRSPTFDGLADFDRVGDRMHAESWREFAAQGVDPFRVACDYAHEIGLEFHASWRVAGFHAPPPHDHFNYGNSFYKQHPEWRGEDRNGMRTPRMSYSYPQVRQFAVDLLREVAQHPIDGVCLLYNRRPPLVEYEPPVVEAFRQVSGQDAREVPADDPSWLTCRAQTLTKFMHEVRVAMDEEQAKQGRSDRIRVSAIVGATEQENLQLAMDLRTWVNRGLVDTLIPYSSEPGIDSSLDAWTNPADISWLLDIARGSSCKVAPNIMPRFLPPDEFRRRASGLYDVGVDHLFFWDCAGPAGRANYNGMWSALRRLGHRDEVMAWKQAGEPSLSSTVTILDRLGDWDLSYQTPG